jgi:hypothetical protein
MSLIRTEVSEESIVPIINMTKIGDLGTPVAATSRLLRLLVTANVPSSPILVTLMMQAIRSSEISVLTRTTLRNIPKDGILHNHRRENLKYYIAFTA